MRTGWLLLMATGCVSSWDLREELALGGGTAFWLDEDGDGWGDPDVDPVDEADPDARFTARNGRDCDDGDRAVTGRRGAACPDQLVAGGSTVLPTIDEGREVLAIIPPTDAVWAAAAAHACGPNGWGGRLAELSDGTLDRAVIDPVEAWVATLPEARQGWAGFVGITHDGAEWTWDTAGSPPPSDIPFCRGQAPEPDDVPGGTLALVRTVDERWCWGVPDDVGIDTYGGQYAHFVCDREELDPSTWAEQQQG